MELGAVEITVIVLVIGARLFLPLLIPYVPVVGLLACLVLDAADQTIFQQFPAIPLDDYQSYDKALDIYYLTIAYLSTLRNWTSRPAFLTAFFLFYYRLIGNLAFELTQERVLLFIFPNTFEYFFLFIELCRMRWDQSRFNWKVSITAAALIWIFVKLPQEWWIHIAELDFTDFVSEYPWVVIPMVVVAIIVLGAAWWIIRYKTAPADHRIRLLADPLPDELRGVRLYAAVKSEVRLLDQGLIQKAALIAIIIVIFSVFLPGEGATPLGIAISVAFFVVLNAFVSQWLARRGRRWQAIAVELAVMMVINLGLVFALELFDRFVGFRNWDVPFLTLLFYIFLVTLLIVFFDRYYMVYAVRRWVEKHGGPEVGANALRERLTTAVQEREEKRRRKQEKKDAGDDATPAG